MTTAAQVLYATGKIESFGENSSTDLHRLTEPRKAALAARWARIAFLICLAMQVWLISAGLWGVWPQYTTRYDILARAFAHGQTHLLVRPDPRHLALPDPYDPVANDVYRHHPGIPDSCLYKGKLYLYWGPVPALMLLPLRAVFGTNFVMGDQFITFFFAQGMVAAIALLLLRLRTRFAQHLPTWTPAAGIFLISLTAPLATVMTRAAVYEAAIVGGQCFLLWGMLIAWISLSCNERRFRRHAGLAAAGMSLALAVGCRVSLAVAVTAVGVLVCYQILRQNWKRPAQLMSSLLAFGLPLVAGAALLAIYNYVRFESILEFGQKYQLAGANLRSYPSLFGPANLWPGLWSYFLRPVAIVGRFPFLLLVPGDNAFPSFITIPEHYETFESIGGLLWTMPIIWLLPIGGLALVRRAVVRRKAAAALSTSQPIAPHDGVRWIVIGFMLASILGFLPVLLMIGSSQRYLVDLIPPLIPVLFVLIGVLCEPGHATPRQTRRWLAVFTCLGLVSVVLGVLLAFEGYAGHFRIQNPELFEELSGPEPVTADQFMPTSHSPLSKAANHVAH